MSHHLISHFWMALAFVRHPISAAVALVVALAAGYLIKAWKR
jgi:hypothetical protein